LIVTLISKRSVVPCTVVHKFEAEKYNEQKEKEKKRS
jgi:hypothetical protein